MIYLFSDKCYEGVEHLPLFEIHYLPLTVSPSSYDAVIFTSKNSVKALALNGVSWSGLEVYAIGEATANAIREEGGSVTFTCKDSYGDEFAHTIAPLLVGKRVFFPRAKEVVSSLFTILKEKKIDIFEAVVYETVCKIYPRVSAPCKNAILIFTSPSTVHCFMQNFSWDESYKAIAIGKKTAAALPLHVKCITSTQQSIEHCIELAKAI